MNKGQRGISVENKIQGRISNNEVFDVWSGFFIVIITTDYISYNGGYNNVYSIHKQSHIPSSIHTAAPLLLKQYCKEGVWTGTSIIQTFVSL